MVAWIVRALFSHSVEEYVLAIGGSNPSRGYVYSWLMTMMSGMIVFMSTVFLVFHTVITVNLGP